jgi:hypothetical protein
MISPIVLADQEIVESEENNRTSEAMTSQTGEGVSQMSDSSSMASTPVESSTVESTIPNFEIPPATQTSSSTEGKSDKKSKVEAKKEPRSEQDISGVVTVNDWWIFEQAINDPLSATTAASAKSDYNFRFLWSLKMPEGQQIEPGEYFCIDFPKNVGLESEGVEGWGFWTSSTTESHKTDLVATIDDVPHTIGQWWIDWRDDGSPQGTYYIKVDFDERVAGKGIDQITGIEFSIPEHSLKNMTLKGGIQEVVFGDKKQRIKFEQAKESYSEGDDYKYAAKAGSNTITFDVGIGRMTLNELSGDVVDYAVNNDKGFYLDGDYHGYRWGENFTDLDDIYVEDTLDPGVVVSSLSLSALVQSPIGLSEENLDMQAGGLINRDTATFESYLFADYGNGPVYRTAGSNQAIQFPKKENSYKLLVQTAGESLEDFRTRVKEQPLQYGIFTEGSGKTAQRTICINVGDIHKGNGIQKKYSDLTDQKYASPERTITRKAGNILGEETIKITQFAVEAADNCIRHGFYPESARELLEDYYTLAYGDSNVINGQVSAFNLSMNLNYPIDETLGETKSNTALAYYETAKQQQSPSFIPPSELTGTGDMSNPYGKIAINTDTIALIKYDGATLTEMNGVEFELQRETTKGNWTAVSTHETAEFTTSEGEKIQGVIRVSGLSNGTYRFVEKASGNHIYPEGYDQTKSGDWDGERIVSSTITVDGVTTNAPVTVENIPIASAPYAVEHYFLKDGKSPESTNQADFELNFVENETGEIRKPIGSIFTGAPRNNLTGYKYKKIAVLEKADGTITAITDPNLTYKENGQLVLRFYYVPDEDAVPFTITKLDATEKPMPSYNDQGEALAHEVSFYIYEFNWGNSENKGPSDAGAEPAKGASNDYWKLVATDNQGNPLEQPVKTDSQGRIRAKIDLTDNGVIGNPKTFAVVEATNTYPNYEAPSVESAWWLLWTGEGKDGGAPKGTFSWCSELGTSNPGCINEGQADKSVNVSLKNKVSKGRLTVYKADQDKNLMPSNEKKQVIFDFYEYLPDGNWEVEGHNPWDSNLLDPTIWKALGTVQTDNDGKILDRELTSVKTYALKEVSSYPSFAVPSGYWILWTSITPEGITNHQVQYVQGSNDDDPGALQPNDEDNPMGAAVLLNKEIKHNFSFIKENEQEEPLGEVEFELYTGKEDETLEIGINDDPNAATTYWDMTKPFKTAISNAAGTNKGQVRFDLVAGNYLLVETKTAFGYQLPQGQWILTIDPLQQDPDQRIKITARGEVLPPAFYKKGGVYHLPNLRKYHLPSSGSIGVIVSVVLGIALISISLLVSKNGKKET